MKKCILTVSLAMLGWLTYGQDYNKLLLMNTQKKYDDAKKEIDKLTADPKASQKAETWMWRATIYSEIGADSALVAKYPDADQVAYDALNKYRSMDTSLKALKDFGLRSVGILYSQYFNSGKKYFGESKWQESFDNFKKAEELGEFVTKNGFSTNTDRNGIDTFTVLYTGFAAQNNKKPEDAIVYYEKLADRKIGTADMRDMYRYMLDYYSDKKEEDKFKKYMAIAKELYPKDNALWSQIELQNMSQNAGLDEMTAKYKEQDSGGKMTEAEYLSFAEAFATPDKDQVAKLDSAQQVQLKLMAADAFKKAFGLKNNGIYAFNTGVLYYNVFSTLDERFFELRGASADLKAKRDEVEKQQKPYADSSIEWLEKSYDILKAKTDREKTETNSLSRAVDYLANLYLWKRDKSKGVNPAEYDKLDAKYKQFDAEHDKYKN